MGVPELVTAMQEIYRQAEAQMAHVPVLERSRGAWQAVTDGLAGTSDQLRETSAAVDLEWPDDVGATCTERLETSATTVRGWQETLAAADLPTVVADLATAVRTTVDGIRELWNVFVQAVGQLGVVGIDAAAVEEALTGIVERAAAMLRELDQRFAEAASRVSGSSSGTPWDGPAADGGGGESTMAAADAPAAGGASPDAGGASPAAGGASPSAGSPAVAAPSPAGAGDLPSPDPVGAGPLAPYSPSPSLAGSLPSLSPAGSSFSPSLSGGPSGSGGLGGLSPAGLGGGLGMIPRAGRTLTGAAPTAGGGGGTAAGQAATRTSAGGATGRGLIPPLFGGGMNGAGGGHGSDPKPGDEASAHRARPIQDVPGVPPALRGRTGTMAETPEFLTGATAASTEPEPLREDLWQAERPPSPFSRRPGSA
ncbi:hypothetical protein [Actinoplanes sp. NBRC 103695]|uniref:hypothetical protein n=1 Tax=Actinoplanes sp. NBRC 103695 TaxID=3032202 RepID=UPI0024A20636|nr:hypothetical protein [Actinoplanes sp. NBRC 103695]GLY97592.1 hypothetical protein Acsp02_48460 [Actinoplanes sp. NBRC 103695]